MMNRKQSIIISMLLALSLSLPGCALADESIINVKEMFTGRDRETGYIEDECVNISLNGETATCDSNAVRVSGGVVTILGEGTFIISGELADGMIIVDADKADKIHIVLGGASVTSQSSAPIYIKQADKVFITLADGTNNALANGGEYIAIDESNIDAAIFSRDDLTLNGLGALSISSPAGHGIVSKDDLVITGGKYDISCLRHGLSANDSVRIADGSLIVNSGNDAIHAENDDDETLGFVYISGGTIALTSGDDGISAVSALQIDGGDILIDSGDDGMHADGQVIINGGNIDIPQSYEGIEGLSILISGGNISLAASDDGLNAAGGADQSGFGGRRGRDAFAADSGASITISGGIIHIDADGDGIDSNGSLSVTGGETYVSGPERSGNGAIDSGSQPVITGGVFVAASAAGMAQGFGDSSTQGAMFVVVDAQPQGGIITLTDESGETLISWQSGKSFSSVVLSCPEMIQGGTYTLTAGTYSKQITLDSLVFSEGGRGNRGMGGRWGRGAGGDWPDRDWDWF